MIEKRQIGQSLEIFKNPEESVVKRLLSDAELPTADLTPGHMEHFFACGKKGDINGVIGLELYGPVALLRSLAVTSPERGRGLGMQLVAHAERYAHDRGVGALYLLTATAEPFFRRLGFERVCRDDVPEAIKATGEYSGICPASAAVMAKALSSGYSTQ
jgi:amino-acid N-acetyltransferase